MWLTLAILVAQAGAWALLSYYAVTRVRMLSRRVSRVEAKPDLTEQAADLQRQTNDLRSKVDQLAADAAAVEGRHLRVVPPLGGFGIGRGLLIGLLLVGLTAAVTWLIADRGGDDGRGGSRDFVAPPPTTTTAPVAPPAGTEPPPGPGSREGTAEPPQRDSPDPTAPPMAGRTGAPTPVQLPPVAPVPPASTVRTTTTTTTAPTGDLQPQEDDGACAAELNLGLLEVCLL